MKRFPSLATFAMGIVLVALAGASIAGCLDRELKPLNPCIVSGVVERVKVSNIEKVDLLFMVDNSNSMAEEQASLTAQFNAMIATLASGDIEGDGTPEFPAVKDLHFAVVSSDMGTGGYNVPTCNAGDGGFATGDDGILRTQGNASIAGCSGSYPSFLGFQRMVTDPVMYAHDAACVATLGTGGCGFEQQLEAVLKAITPSTSPIAFNNGTRGHADLENNGFIRPDSLLALVLVTDEEDCSAVDVDIYNPASSRFPGDLNLRCFMYPSAVHPVERYVDGFLATRTDPDLLIYAAITGVPQDLVANPDTINLQAILDDSRMVERVDSTSTTPRLVPSCSVPGRGIAFPPRRIVSVAKLLEERNSNGIVQSICQEDFGGALQAIIEKIADVLGGTCLPRSLVRVEGQVNCDVIEILPAGATTCAAGRVDDGFDDENLKRCKINQLAVTCSGPGACTVPTGDGWYYDDFSADVTQRCMTTPQRIAFGGPPPETGVTVRLECLQPVQELGGGLGSPCSNNTECTTLNSICDSVSNTCRGQCQSNVDCPASFVCDTARSVPVCVNPTCGS